MQRSLGIGLLAVFAYALVGIYPAQWAVRRIAHSEMWCSIQAGKLDAARVVALSFPTTNGRVNDPRFAWEDDDEFLFQGAMYDVVSLTVSEGRITFHCIADKEEDAMVKYAALLDPLSDIGNAIAGNGHSPLKSMAKHYLGKHAAPRPVHEGGIQNGFAPRAATVLQGFTRPVSRPPWA